MWRLLLLGLVAGCARVLVATDSQPDQQRDRSVPEEDGVLQLKKSNFNRALRKHKQLLVHFCKLHARTHTAWFSCTFTVRIKQSPHTAACSSSPDLCLFVFADTPLSGEGNQVAAAFEDAAAELRGSEVKLAVVDVTKEKDLAKQLNATGPPTVRLYLSGDKHNPVPCPGTCKWQTLQHSFLTISVPHMVLSETLKVKLFVIKLWFSPSQLGIHLDLAETQSGVCCWPHHWAQPIRGLRGAHGRWIL